ncbi:MAG: SAP domain-containing protein [Candidatus Thermoplasmatota archaeon]|nr:SAP domain-containing protein [Candidatus Thermoplasmatota archaeon]
MAVRSSAQSRNLARKQGDKWKAKRLYSIRAPRHPWQYKKIGETIGENAEFVAGRIFQTTQQEFDGDFTKMHVKLNFRIVEIVNQDAITEFVGHEHQNDHIRRQIRRYRGKVDAVVDVVTNDGYLVRLKPLVVTEGRVTSSMKKVMRRKVTEIITTFGSSCTYPALQKAILGSEIETSMNNALNPIAKIRSAVIAKSQLLKSGVVSSEGPTLDEIHAAEVKAEADLKARKEAATAEDAPTILEAAEAMESISEKASDEVVEESTDEKEGIVSESASEEVDYSSMTVPQLKELLKEAGKPVSGKKSELIDRLNGE